MVRLIAIVCVGASLAACSVGNLSMPGISAPPVRQASLGGPADRTSATTGDPLDMVNALRRAHGLGPLRHEAHLTAAAQSQAANLARTGVLGHVGADGSTPIDRVRRAGYDPRVAAENVAGGQTSFAQALQMWRDGPSHEQNLLIADVRDVGIAELSDPSSRYKTYWVLVVAARNGRPEGHRKMGRSAFRGAGRRQHNYHRR